MQVDSEVFRFRIARFALLAAMVVASPVALAISQGVSNTTLKPGSSGSGCASCHNLGGTAGGDPNGNVASVTITGPATLDAGASGIYTVTATQTAVNPGVKMGFNVAADDGTLGVVTGQSTVIFNGEITHSANNGMILHTTGAGGTASYQFRYTMPGNAASASSHVLYATAALGSQGGWRHAANFTVTTGAAASNPPRLFNLSTRMQVLTGNDVMIGGFVVGGSAAKTVVVRARGPSLAAAGVPGAMADPNLQLFSGPTQLEANDDWTTSPNATAIQTSGFAPSDGKESAIIRTLNPGAYTAIVSGINSGTGVAIVEVFEVDAVTVPLINIATRGFVQTGSNVMIGGFVVQGTGPQTVVIRARGPSLAATGLPNLLANPLLQLFQGQTQLAANDDWGQAANAAAISGSGFAPSNAQESAIMLSLQPGGYTAIVSGVNGTTGTGIVEVFTTDATP